MIITLNTSTYDSRTVLYIYDSGGTCYVLLENLSGLATDGVPLAVTQTYSDLRTTLGTTFAQVGHATYTNIMLNPERVKSISASSVITFDNGRTVTSNASVGTITTALNATGSTSVAWGGITGTLSAQTDLQTALDGKQPIDATLTALAGLATGANQVPYSTGTDTFSQIDLSELLLDLNIKGLNLLGSTIKGQNLGLSNTMTYTTASMTSGRVYWIAVYIPQDCTITGVKWGQTTQGNYTATAYNGVGLYSYSGGTLTQIAASTDDGAIWKGTGSTMQTKAFSGTVAVTRGIYFIAATYNQSAQTTAPALNALTTVQWLCNGDLTNSAKITGTTVATALPSPTQAISGVTAASTFFYFQLY